ncbi:MAG: DUF2202 domain-containing protein [Planctomycetota bacterium]|nr:DUF2202 domain-containing protein [Planctomycetota bacterium]
MTLLLPLLLVVLFFAPPLLEADEAEPPAKAEPKAKADAKGCGCGSTLEAAFRKIEKTPLSAEVTKQLLHMRQEEKLARDVYRTLGKRWKLRPFTNIQGAEQRHIEHVQMLMKHYGIEDPVTDDTVGVFPDPAMRALYTRLTAQGLKSEVEALRAGMTIEDLDIADLRALLAMKGANAHVRLVAHNLLKGSRNHMRAFARNLAARKATYKPQRLTQKAIDAIVAADHERGVVYDQDGKPLKAAASTCGCGGKGQGKGQGKCKGKGQGKCKGKGHGKGKGRGKGKRHRHGKGQDED